MPTAYAIRRAASHKKRMISTNEKEKTCVKTNVLWATLSG